MLYISLQKHTLKRITHNLLDLEIDHICFAVKSKEEVKRVFGLDVEFELLENQGVFVGYKEKTKCALEFIQPFSNKSVESFIRNKKTPVFHHLAFRVDSIFKFIKTHKYAYTYEVPQVGYKGKLIQFALKESVLFEFCENLGCKIEGKSVLISKNLRAGYDVWIYPSWDIDEIDQGIVVPLQEWGWNPDKIYHYFSTLGATSITCDS